MPSPTLALADPSAGLSADAVVVATVSGGARVRLAPGAADVDAALGGRLLAALAALDAKGTPGEVLRVPTLGEAPFPLVVATGVGANPRDPEALRRATGAALRTLSTKRTVHVAIDGPTDALAEGAAFGSYAFTEYKSGARTAALRKVTFPRAAGAAAALKHARAVADAVTTARDLVNTPPNDLYPETFAQRIVALAERAGLATEVLGPRELARGGYGGVLAVGGGSARPPRLVRIAHRPSRPRGRVALVGKGITFDTGGLNLKSANLTWMKSDMAGAAAVAASVLAAAALRLPVEVVATIPIAENMPSGSAYRPSDVITMRSGHTVEIADTDAEGRLVLADAISRALEDEPQQLIEISTLTGGQLTALGTRVIGAMGEPGLRDLVTRAGNAVGESVWAMPLPDDLRSGLDSPVADLVNTPDEKWGQMLVGGLFLARFMAADVPWVHLDMAGPGFNSGAPRDYTPKGGTGAGVRTIVAALDELASR